jgi:inosose dehydratase
MNRVGVAACTWGLEPGFDWVPARDPDGVVETAAALGFEGIEPATGNGYGQRLAAVLGRSGLACPARFVSLPLADEHAALARGVEAARDLASLGGTLLLVGSHETSGAPSGDVLDRLASAVAGLGMRVAVHPEIGTAIASAEDIDAVLDRTVHVDVCLDTGHVWVAGSTDLAGAVRRWGARIAHVHLKDADSGLAAAVRDGAIDPVSAVRAGLWRPLGEGDVPVAATVEALLAQGYAGWYVVEDDISPDPDRSARAGLEYVRSRLPHNARG